MDGLLHKSENQVFLLNSFIELSIKTLNWFELERSTKSSLKVCLLSKIPLEWNIFSFSILNKKICFTPEAIPYSGGTGILSVHKRDFSLFFTLPKGRGVDCMTSLRVRQVVSSSILLAALVTIFMGGSPAEATTRNTPEQAGPARLATCSECLTECERRKEVCQKKNPGSKFLCGGSCTEDCKPSCKKTL